MMVVHTNKTAQMLPCKNLWKELQALCPSKTPPMSLLPLFQRSRKWMEVKLSNHQALLLRIPLLLNLLLPCKILLKPPPIRRKRTIRASKPSRTLLRPNKNSLLNLVTRRKKKLSQTQKLRLPTSNENELFESLWNRNLSPTIRKERNNKWDQRTNTQKFNRHYLTHLNFLKSPYTNKNLIIS